MKRSGIGMVVYVLALTSFITITFAFARYVFSQITPQIVVALNMDYEFVGRIHFLNQGFYLVFAIVGGVLSTRVGPRILVSSATLICGASILALSTVTNKWMLLGIVSLQGVFTAISWVPMVELVSRTVPEKNRGMALGVISSGTSYGVILSGLATPHILAAYDWAMVWRFFGIVSLVLGIAGACIVYTFKPNETNTELERFDSPGPPRADLRAVGLLIVLSVVSGAYLVPYQLYLTPFVELELGGNHIVSGRAWTILGFMGLVSGFGGGYLADRLSAKKAMAIAYSLSFVALLVLVSFKGIGFIYLSCVFFALTYNAIFGFHPTYISRVLPPQQTAKLFGFVNLGLGFGAMIGSYVTGYIKEHSGGFYISYTLMCGLAALAALICLRLKNDRRC